MAKKIRHQSFYVGDLIHIPHSPKGSNPEYRVLGIALHHNEIDIIYEALNIATGAIDKLGQSLLIVGGYCLVTARVPVVQQTTSTRSSDQCFMVGDILESLPHGQASQVVHSVVWDPGLRDFIYRLIDQSSAAINTWPQAFIISWGYQVVGNTNPATHLIKIKKHEGTNESQAALVANTEPTCLCLFPSSHDDDCAWKLWRNSKT